MIFTIEEIKTEFDILKELQCKTGEESCDICKNSQTLVKDDLIRDIMIALMFNPEPLPYFIAKFIQIGYNISEKRILEKMVTS